MTTRMTSTHCTSTIAWRFTTLTSTSTECTHARIVSPSLIIHTRIGSSSLRLVTCHPHAIHVCDLFTLNSTFNFPAFLLSFFLFPFFHLSDEQQPTTGVRAPTTSSTSSHPRNCVECRTLKSLQFFHLTEAFLMSFTKIPLLLQ